MTVPPGLASVLEQLHDVGITKRRGYPVCTHSEEDVLSLSPAAPTDDLYGGLAARRAGA